MTVLTGCTSLSKKTTRDIEKVKTTQAKVEVVEKKLSSNTKVYVDGALRLLKKQPVEHVTKQTTLAIRLLENAQEIEGVPLHALRLDVDILAKDTQNNTELVKLQELESDHRQAMEERVKLEEQIQALRGQIEEDALKLAQIHNKSWFTKLKDWIFDYIKLIAAIISGLIFGPKLIRFITKKYNERTT